MTGDIDERMIAEAAGYGKVAVDVQGFLRCAGEDGAMTFRDWENKRLYLPHIDYLKTDAAEAEILTGVSDRRRAARILHRWGASEVLITHNTEVLAFDGSQMRTCPIRARNLSGRTGRGDTAFAGYITERPVRKPVPGASLLHRAGVSENGERGALPGHAGGRAGVCAGVLSGVLRSGLKPV